MPDSTVGCWRYPRADAQNTGYIAGLLRDSLTVQWSVELKTLDPSSPTIFDDKVFVALRTKRIPVFECDSGEKIADLWLDVPMLFPPVFHDRKMWYFGFGAWNRVGVYDLSRGKVKWSRSAGDAEVFGSPCDSVFVIATLRGGIYGLSVDDGEKIWENRRRKYIKTTIAIDSGKIFVATGKEILSLSCDGEILWRKVLDKNPAGALIITDGKIFAQSADGEIFALSTENGDILWNKEVVISGGLPMATDGKILVTADKGGKIIALDPNSGDLLWKSELGDIISAAPIIVGETVVAVTYTGKIFIIDIKNGRTKSCFELNEPIRQSPVSDGGKIFIATASGKLFCLQ